MRLIRQHDLYNKQVFDAMVLNATEEQHLIIDRIKVIFRGYLTL